MSFFQTRSLVAEASTSSGQSLEVSIPAVVYEITFFMISLRQYSFSGSDTMVFRQFFISLSSFFLLPSKQTSSPVLLSRFCSVLKLKFWIENIININLHLQSQSLQMTSNLQSGGRLKQTVPNSEVRSSHYQSSQQQYEQEFWKLKAQRLQLKNQEIIKENQLLLKNKLQAQQVIDKQACQSIEIARSRRKDQVLNKGKSAETLARQEVEKLGKEIATLKNAHSIELTKLNDDNKRLKKKVGELQNRLTTWVSSEDHAIRVKTLNEENSTLGRRLGIVQQQLDRLKQQKRKLLEDNDNLRKQLQQTSAKLSAIQKQEEQNLLDRRKYESIVLQYKAEKYQTPSSHHEHQPQPQPHPQHQSQEEIERLKQAVSSLQKEKQNGQKALLQISSWEHDKARAQFKIKQMETQLLEAKSELKNVLTKLSPLLGQKSDYKGKQNVQAKASLTLLQIFLQKYKIQAF